MLRSVNGYIEGNKVIVDENLTDWQGRNVIVTILDSVWKGHSSESDSQKNEENRKNAALELSGLWNDHEEELSVEETVRCMRRRRCFDN